MTKLLTALKGIGEKTAGYYAKLGLYDTAGLIRHYPREYDHPPKLKPLSEAREGEEGAFFARVLVSPSFVRAGRLLILNLKLGDDQGSIAASFYNMPYLKNALKPGTWKVFRGTPVKKGGKLLLRQPGLYSREEYAGIEDALLPVYPLGAHLTQKALGKAMLQAISEEKPEEYLPEGCREGLLSREQAFGQIHFPDSPEMALKARNRLIYDEFFAFLLNIRRMKRENLAMSSPFSMIPVAECRRLIESLPYPLTNAQQRVFRECEEGMLSGRVMNRLIQGDVGSGKTILALLAILLACANGYQAALMAPTEVLAVQHYREILSLTERFGLPLKPVLLSGSLTKKAKQENRQRLSSGEANLAVGTHAVITDSVSFKELALVITDEQHRFGVRQREKLSEKGNLPHTIVMSATPIPRTLAMILYGDLEISLVDELPGGRLPVKNAVISGEERKKALQFLVKQIREGHQAYVICPMVENSGEEASPEYSGPGTLMNVTDYTRYLNAVLPEDIRVGSLNGRMKPEAKNRVMEEFSRGELQVLVSTTVVEVGVNVPNATIMVIENAERYGLAALHQLRGRVGRGASQSFCILINGSGKKEAAERLNLLASSNNGFVIAEKDLALRGPGDFFGFRQSGELPFALGDIYRDAGLLRRADRDAERILAEDPELEAHPELFALLNREWNGEPLTL